MVHGRYTGAMGKTQENALRIGPAGWSYADWKGIVYQSDRPHGKHALELIASWFDTVEINVSFYRALEPNMTAAWAEKVRANPRFRFAAKLWRRFTHDRDSFPSDSETAAYRRGIAPLAEAGLLGVVLMQFPWSFRRTAENRRWLAKTIDALSEYPLAIEVRHASWMCEEFLGGLHARGIAFCNIDQPVIGDSIGPAAEVTAPVAYVRFHGRNRDAWFANDVPSYERYNYLYSADELTPWVKRIASMHTQAEETYVITNNHFQGKGVVNAFELAAALGRPTGTIPSDLVRAYPRLRRLADPDHLPANLLEQT